MMKTIAALGVIAALGLTPVVALAQTDTTTPAPAAAAPEAPMKSTHKMKSHKKMSAQEHQGHGSGRSAQELSLRSDDH